MVRAPWIVPATRSEALRRISRNEFFTLVGSLVDLPHLFDIRQHPGAVEVGLSRAVETEVSKPAFARDGLDPVGFWFASRGFRPEVKVHRAVGVLHNIVA